MVITVTFPTTHHSSPPGSRRRIDVTLLSGSTLAELIPDLGLALPLEKTLLAVNGRPSGLDTVLHHGDLVDLTYSQPDSPTGA